jgi:sortase B
VAERRTQIRPVAIPDPLEDRPAQVNTGKSNNTKPNDGPDKRSGFLFGFTIFMSVITGALVFLIAAAVLTRMSDLNELRAVNEALVQVKKDAELPPDDAEALPAETEDLPEPSAFDKEMAAINPDYVCWLKIDDTVVDYPVVQAEDNEKYLSLSFDNVENVYGSIFMDYRCALQNAPHVIIYGHNTKDGDMFGGLRYFLNEAYRQEHPVFTLSAGNKVYQYEIFSARITDVTDPAYNLFFDEPGSFESFLADCGSEEGARQIVTLSTCVSGDDKDERVVVQGRLL